MARHAGRFGRLYVELSPPGSAEPIAFLNKWTADFKTNRTNVEAFEDNNMVYVAGLPDSQFTFAGHWGDTSHTALYTAAQDGTARKFYLYPDRQNNPNFYWYGTGLFDYHIEGDVAGEVPISGTFVAASTISQNAA